MERQLELLIKKTALKDVEIWLNEQYLEIDKELKQLEPETDYDKRARYDVGDE